MVLIAYCAIYTGAWGWVMLTDPQAYFDFANMSPELFPPSTAFWGWFGLSGLLFYGLYLVPSVHQRAPGYAIFCTIASLAGVIITAYHLIWGTLTGSMAAIHLSGDLAGTIGFGAAAWLDYAVRRDQRVDGLYFKGGRLGDISKKFTTSRGISLYDLTQQKETLIVFLRHFGCTFCREALEDVARQRNQIESEGKTIVLVHMVDLDTAAKHLTKYGLADAHHISDPDKELYAAFELKRGRLGQLFGLPVWFEGFRAGILQGHLVGKETGDGFQMPGTFLVQGGKIKQGFRNEKASDRPNYCRVGECQ